MFWTLKEKIKKKSRIFAKYLQDSKISLTFALLLRKNASEP